MVQFTGQERQITLATTLPARQFITAGRANESAPAISAFTPAFIDAIKYKLADLNGDGYVSGTELGLYLQSEVPKHTDQTPQYGKITDYKLSREDYIFLSGGSMITEKESGGGLTISTTPFGAEIVIDGKSKGRSPLELTGLPAGKYNVKSRKEGYESWEETVLVRSGRRTDLRPEDI